MTFSLCELEVGGIEHWGGHRGVSCTTTLPFGVSPCHIGHQGCKNWNHPFCVSFHIAFTDVSSEILTVLSFHSTLDSQGRWTRMQKTWVLGSPGFPANSSALSSPVSSLYHEEIEVSFWLAFTVHYAAVHYNSVPTSNIWGSFPYHPATFFDTTWVSHVSTQF